MALHATRQRFPLHGRKKGAVRDRNGCHRKKISAGWYAAKLFSDILKRGERGPMKETAFLGGKKKGIWSERNWGGKKSARYCFSDAVERVNMISTKKRGIGGIDSLLHH